MAGLYSTTNPTKKMLGLTLITLFLITTLSQATALDNLDELSQTPLTNEVTDKTWNDELTTTLDKTSGQLTINNARSWLKITPDDTINAVEGEKVKYNGYDAVYYKIDDGFEFEIDFHEKPASRTISIPINHKGLTFYYQDDLANHYDKNKYLINDTHVLSLPDLNVVVERPENVVGSYAVYEGDTKFMHIYRPWIEDAKGYRVWCELFIDENEMTIVIPELFLDIGVLPFKLDPTFGYTTQGAAWHAQGVTDRLYGSNFTLAVNANITAISFYNRFAQPPGSNVTAVMYNSTDGLIIESAPTNPGIGWNHFNLTAPVTVDPDEYLLMIHQNTSINYAFDIVATNQSQRSGVDAFGDGAADPYVGAADYYLEKTSIYATYIELAGGTPELHVTQAQIMYPNNTEVRLRGINYNYFNNFVGGFWFANQVNNYGAWNITMVEQEIDVWKTTYQSNVVRLILNAEWLRSNPNNHTDMVDEFVDACNRKDMYVIWTFYNVNQSLVDGREKLPYPPYADATNVERVIANETDYRDFMVNEMGPIFFDYPNLIIEPYNEPNGNATLEASWKAVHEQLVVDLRAAGYNNLIVAQWGFGVWYNLDFGGGTFLDWIDTMNWNDTATNLVYSTHIYRKFDGTGLGKYTLGSSQLYWDDTSAYTFQEVNTSLTAELFYWAKLNKSVPLFIGEEGIRTIYPSLANQVREKNAWIEYFRIADTLNLSYTQWWFRTTPSYALLSSEVTLAPNQYADIFIDSINGSLPNLGPMIVNSSAIGTLQVNQVINITADFYDYHGSDYGWIESDFTGVFVNASYVNLTDTSPGDINYLTDVTLPALAGTYTARIYGNDTLGEEYNGTVLTIVVTGGAVPPPGDEWQDSIVALITILPLLAVVFFLGTKFYELRSNPVFIMVIAVAIFGAFVWIARNTGWI